MVHYRQQLLEGLFNTHTHTHKSESKNFENVAIQVGQVLCILMSIIQSNLSSANTVLCKNISVKGILVWVKLKMKIHNDNETFIQYTQRSTITEKQLIYIKRMDNIRV
jgi:cobalamin biosynthesis protein CbiD